MECSNSFESMLFSHNCFFFFFILIQTTSTNKKSILGKLKAALYLLLPLRFRRCSKALNWNLSSCTWCVKLYSWCAIDVLGHLQHISDHHTTYYVIKHANIPLEEHICRNIPLTYLSYQQYTFITGKNTCFWLECMHKQTYSCMHAHTHKLCMRETKQENKVKKQNSYRVVKKHNLVCL